MIEFLRNSASDRLKGAIALAVILFGILMLSGGPSESPLAAKAEAGIGAVYGPFYTLDDF